MAKYLVTNGSYFQPFTYDELAKPIVQTVEAHHAAQDAYDTWSDQAELLRRYVEQEPDNALVRQRYDDYMNKLEALQNNLWRNGYNASTRRDLSAARAGYNSDIMRIGNAIKARQESSDLYHKYKMEHPDAAMGADPGLDSLDAYYTDDRHGKDFFVYSGEQLSKEVSADVKAMASELLRNPDVIKDPRLVGYLTRIEKKGFTNQEKQNAIEAVSALVSNNSDDLTALYNVDTNTAFAGLDDPSKMLAKVFFSHLLSTGAPGKVSADEFDKLVRFGSFGVSSAVGESSSNVLTDKKYERETELLKKAASGKESESANTRRDRYIRNVPGVNYEKTYKNYVKEFGEDGVIASKSGLSVKNSAEAASRVYSNDERIKFMGESGGIDVGLDSRHQKGEYTKDGKTYETWYNKSTDQVLYKEKGTNQRPRVSKSLTDKYHKAKDEYDKNLKWYRENAPEIYDAAKRLDPETQRSIYERDKIPFDTPITDYKDILFGRPENKRSGVRSETYLARRGVDLGKYIERFSGLIYNELPKDKKGEVTHADRWTVHNGKYSNIHELNDDGSLKYETVKNPNDVFKFDDKRNITNIEDIRLSLDSIMNGYVICGFTDSNKDYSIGIDMLDSAEVEAIFDEARYALRFAQNDYDIEDIINEATGDLMDLLGYDITTMSHTGTSEKSKN